MAVTLPQPQSNRCIQPLFSFPLSRRGETCFSPCKQNKTSRYRRSQPPAAYNGTLFLAEFHVHDIHPLPCSKPPTLTASAMFQSQMHPPLVSLTIPSHPELPFAVSAENTTKPACEASSCRVNPPE